MAYPNRLVVYLAAPKRAHSALINVLAFTDPKIEAKETDFTKTSTPKKIPRRGRVFFTISAVTESDTIVVSGLSVNWDGGCRLVPECRLGDKGDVFARINGIHYDNTTELPVKHLHCAFSGAGVLTCTDGRGVAIVMDLTKPGSGALCLTVTAEPGSCGRVTFRRRFLPTFKIVQPEKAKKVKKKSPRSAKRQ